MSGFSFYFLTSIMSKFTRLYFTDCDLHSEMTNAHPCLSHLCLQHLKGNTMKLAGMSASPSPVRSMVTVKVGPTIAGKENKSKQKSRYILIHQMHLNVCMFIISIDKLNIFIFVNNLPCYNHLKL